MAETVISVRNLSKRYTLGGNAHHGTAAMLRELRSLFGRTLPDEGSVIWALKDVNFEVKKGERLGFVGKNGAGKSTLLKILSRVAYPTEGEARIRGRVTSLLEVGTGFLNHLTGRQNVYLNASFHGLSKKEIDARLPEIMEFSELGRFIDTPIKFYSSGMRARLAFSVAAHLDPDILLLDEVLSVGDMAFAQKCLQKVENLTTGDRTILFVSHSMDSVRRFCNRCIWLDSGQVVMEGPVHEVTNAFTNNSLNLQGHKMWTPPPPPEPEPEEEPEEKIAPAVVDLSHLPDSPHARLVAASVLTPDGRQTSSVSVSDDIPVEVIYDILYDNAYVVPVFRVYNEQGILLFFIIHHKALPDTYRRNRGRYRSVATIPGNLMAVGKHTISVGLNTPASGKLIRHDIAENALSFYVHEASIGQHSALGPYASVKGAVRPLCEWTDEKISVSEEAA